MDRSLQWKQEYMATMANLMQIDRSGTSYQKKGDGGVIFDIGSPLGSRLIQMKYADVSRADMAGSLDIRLAVTAISSEMAGINPNTLIRY